MINAQRFAHTMNPHTAAPVQTGPAAVTVLHQDCVYADALATVLWFWTTPLANDLLRSMGLT
jgi:thiamine biosynthesis lipoprotein